MAKLDGPTSGGSPPASLATVKVPGTAPGKVTIRSSVFVVFSFQCVCQVVQDEKETIAASTLSLSPSIAQQSPATTSARLWDFH